MAANPYRSEIIAVWRRSQDGMEICLRRDERMHFRHGPDSKFLPGSQKMTIEETHAYATEHGYKRVQDTE